MPRVKSEVNWNSTRREVGVVLWKDLLSAILELELLGKTYGIAPMALTHSVSAAMSQHSLYACGRGINNRLSNTLQVLMGYACAKQAKSFFEI